MSNKNNLASKHRIITKRLSLSLSFGFVHDMCNTY